jgi:ubiquitin carboxyl-terminal hydrolase L5
MLQYEENQLSFNLLAVCQSPLATYSQNIARTTASLQYLRTNTKLTDFEMLVRGEKLPLDVDDESQLSEFNLTKSDIASAQIPDTLQDKLKRPTFDAQFAYELYQELIIEIKAAMGEYRAEMIAISDDEQRVKGRKKDYGPALHKWMSKLAEKGVLEDVIEATTSKQ